MVFSFFVPDAGPVTLGDGLLDIDIDVEVGDPCDPLQQNCGAGEACYQYSLPGTTEGAFGCFSVQVEGAQFDTCELLNECSIGLMCAASFVHSSCDATNSTCCLPFCDVSAPDCGAGETCTSFDAGDPNIGICTQP